MINENFCEDVRSFLPKMVGKQFTVKQFAKQLMPRYTDMPLDMRSKIEIKISEELSRCRSKDDKIRTRRGKFPKAKSKHAHYMDDLGISVRVLSYKSRNSEGGRRPALLYTAEKIGDKFSNFYQSENSLLDNISYDAFLDRMPRDVIIQYVFNNIMKDGA